MKYILSVILSATASHAGWFSRLCEKLIIEDPYQYEEYGIDYVIRTAEHLRIASKWRMLNQYEQETFDILIKELEMRRHYGPDIERNQADEALIKLAH